MRSIGSVLDETKGLGQGFDFLRIFLSISVLCLHSIGISYGVAEVHRIWMTPAGAVMAAVLPVFFALSGFLVMGSALRVRSLTTFISFRALRIAPALATDVFIAAVLIGGFATKCTVESYYSSPGFYAYFLNIFGHIEYRLPGVFGSNPDQIVNGSLWTIPPEIFCYVFLALTMVAGICTNRRMYTAIVLAIAGAIFVLDSSSGRGQYQGALEQYHLVLSFAFGNLLYHYRYQVPYTPLFFAVLLVVGLLLDRSPMTLEIALAALTYCIVYLGLLRIPKLPLLSRGDYSYGVYLYGFPIQQVVTLLLPDLRTWYWNILISLPSTLACAVLSWHYVEAPTLKLKNRFRSFANTEGRYLDNAPVCFFIAAVIATYAVALMHWCGFEDSLGFTFRVRWKETILAVLAIGIIAVSGRKFALRSRTIEAPA